MLSKMVVEYYPLWMEANPELFEKSKAKFLLEASEGGLNVVREYWQSGLFYMEAV